MRKHKLKGMTLVECIIALAIFSVAASVLTTVCIGVVNSKKKTAAINNKMTYEGPVADNMKTDSELVSGADDVIKIQLDGSTYSVKGKYYEVKEKDGDATDHNYKFFKNDNDSSAVSKG